MQYQIIRVDGEVDDITSQSFENYDSAYDLLATIYEDLCCSDADDDDRTIMKSLKLKCLETK